MNKVVPLRVVPPQSCPVRESFAKDQQHLLPEDEGRVLAYCILVLDTEGAATHRYVYTNSVDLLALTGALAELQLELLSTRGDVEHDDDDDDTP